MTTPTAQWKGDNQAEIENLLSAFVVRTDRFKDDLLITGINGMNIELHPGDCIIVEGERLGIVRVPEAREIN